ncbi:MAG: hypothetical protein GF330_11545, partial [Candidatus Eisenbacteria bacterium]|nr:hypothetical protein [Candidatus Eisenbacteria bacterium]
MAEVAMAAEDRAGWRRLLRPLRGLRRVYVAHPWLVIALLWGGSFALGLWGMHRHLAVRSGANFWLEAAYRTLQLFLLEDGMLAGARGAYPWQLEVARFAAPLVTALTGVTALLTVLRDEFSRLRLRQMHGHTIICGLGEKGILLLERFRDRGEPVVGIERDLDSDALRRARRRGAICLAGDAREPDLLARARAARARRVIAVCGEDGTNTEIAANCGALVRGMAGRSLTCLAHVTDPRLCGLLRQREIMGPLGGSFWLELFSIYDIGARAMLRDHPPFDPASAALPRVLLAGLGRMGERLLVHLMHAWEPHCERGDRPMRVTVVDQEAGRKLAELQRRLPKLAQILHLDARDGEAASAAQRLAAPRGDAAGARTPTLVYICLGNETEALLAALAWRGVLAPEIPIVVRMRHVRGLTALLRGPDA